jgi:glycosyltransferase involved in cell wall biosynthesis
MKLLVVSISAPPKNSPESVQTGRYLQYLSSWHEVTLLTTRVAGGWAPADSGLMKFLQRVCRIELSAYPYRVMRLLRSLFPLFVIPDEEVDFAWQYKKAIRKVGERPDIIFSRSAPFSSAVMANRLAKYWKCPWIMHLSDPWVNNPFFNHSTDERQRHEQMERECFERAAAVTFTSHLTIAFYKERYPAMKSKFHFLPNVFDAASIHQQPLSWSGKFRIVFTGRLYRTRSIHQFMNLFKITMERWPALLDQVELILAGFFDQENIDAVRDANLTNVSYEGPVSLERSIDLQRSATLLLLIDALEDDPRFDLFFPSKILDYMAANRPILAFTRETSTTHSLIDGKMGACFSMQTISMFPDYLREMVEKFHRHDESAFRIDHQSRDTYSAEVNSARLNDIIKQIAHGR